MTGEITVNNSYYVQSPLKGQPYTDTKGNTYASYDEYIKALKDNYYIKFKNEALVKEDAYRKLKGMLSQCSAKVHSLFTLLQRDPKNGNLRQNYNITFKSYSDLQLNENCAWWSWHDAVSSQQKAILV